jgi:hypothetical protein
LFYVGAAKSKSLDKRFHFPKCSAHPLYETPEKRNVYECTSGFNIAMENGPFIDGLPSKNGDFPWLC